MKNDLISVIVLVYNNAKYVRKCLNSILKQTYENLEVIVINDGSTDRSIKIINQMASKDKRITVIDRENRGTYQSRLEGYKLAKGKFIMYVDSDDYIEKNMIEIMYGYMLEYKTDVVQCQYKILKNNKIEIPRSILNRNVLMDIDSLEPQFFDLLYKTLRCNQIWKQLIRKSKMKNISKINRNLIYGEDLACNLKIYKEMKSILFIPDELYVYNINNDGIARKKEEYLVRRKLEDAMFVYYELYSSIKEFDVKDKKFYKKLVAAKMFYYLMLFSSELISCTKSNKHEIIDYLNTISKDKRIKEFRKIIEGEDLEILYEEIKRSRKLDIKGCRLLIEDKIPKLYNYNKFFYNPIKNIYHKIKK